MSPVRILARLQLVKLADRTVACLQWGRVAQYLAQCLGQCFAGCHAGDPARRGIVSERVDPRAVMLGVQFIHIISGGVHDAGITE